jgi:hypothetical protein
MEEEEERETMEMVIEIVPVEDTSLLATDVSSLENGEVTTIVPHKTDTLKNRKDKFEQTYEDTHTINVIPTRWVIQNENYWTHWMLFKEQFDGLWIFTEPKKTANGTAKMLNELNGVADSTRLLITAASNLLESNLSTTNMANEEFVLIRKERISALGKALSELQGTKDRLLT